MSKAKDALKSAFKMVAIMWLPAYVFKTLGWITKIVPFLGMTAVTTFIGVLMGPGTPAVRNNFGTKVAVRSPTMGRGIVYGQARVQPLIAFVETTGTNNAIMHMVVVLAGHEIEELVSVSFNDTVLTSTTSTINGTTVHTVNNTRYVNTDNESNFGSGALIRYTFEDGSQTAANPFMVAQSSLTTDHKFLSCSYIYIQMAYDAEAFGGIPALSAVVKGKKCYDPRTGSTAYTDNPALHIRDYISNTTYGLKAPTAEINDAATGGGFAAAANICDQLVTLDDSSTEKRFTSNGLTTMTANGTGVIQGLLSTMAGTLTYTNGQFGIFPGVAQTASLSITDDELLAPISIMTNDPQGAMFNEVKPIFIDSTQNYIPTDGPVYSSTTYLNQDTPTGASSTNYVKRLEQNFSFTTKATEAQRLARIHLNQSRNVTSLSCLVSLKYMQLQPNDWVQVTNERLSYTNKNFRVMSVELEMTEVEDVPVVVTRLELTEVDSSIYSFSGYEDMVDEGTGVGTGDNSVAAPSGLALSASLVVTGYELEATWTNNSSDIVQGTEVKFGTSTGNYIGSVVVGRGQNKAVIPSLTKNTTYYVAARHFSTNGVYSDLTDEVTFNTASSSDINIPQVASSLSATTGKPLQIGVSWTAPTNSDIRAVKIYRRTSDTTPTDDTHLVDTITSEPGTTQKVTFGKEDGLSADTTYYFWLRSISFFGKESAFSSSVSGSFTDVTGTDISTSTKITAGTGNNVGVLDGADSTYRIYAGHATPASAPFRVTQTGALTATNATITGNITASSLNVTGATVTGTLDASVITLNGNALSGLMGSSGTGSSTVLAVGPDVKNQIKVGGVNVEYLAYDDVTEQGHKALDMQFGSTTYYPTTSMAGWQSTIISPGDSSTTGYLSAPSYILQNAGSSVTSTTNRLYNLNGTLYWDGNVVGLGSGTITGVVAGTNLNGGGTSGSVTLNLDSTITGNHTFSNNVVIGGDLTVQGTTTTIDTTNLDVKDKNITLNYGSGDTSGNADGAGITIQDAVDASTNATLLWDQPNSKFDFSHPVNVSHGTPYLKLHDTSSSATTTITLDGVNTTIDSNGTDGDIIFKGSDGGTEITALTLDMSEGGTASFLHDIKVPDYGQLLLGGDADFIMGFYGTTDGSKIKASNAPLTISTETSDKDIIFKGNDGGSTITALTLDMSSAGAATFNSGATLGGNLTLSYAYPRINLTDTNNDSDYSIINNDGSFGIYDVTNSAYRLTISASGHLEIKKTTDFGNTTTYGGSTQRGLISWNAGTKFKIRAATSHALSLGAGGIEDYLYIQTDGKVGINTTTVNALLHISHATAPTFRLSRTGTGQIWQQSIDSSGRFLIQEAASEGGTKYTRFAIDDSGQTGIGTGSPTQALQVNGNIKLETTGSEYVFAAATASNNVDAGHRYNSAQEYVATFTGATERLRIDSSGRVGIGTTSPSQTLDVAGNIQATGSRSIASLYDANHYMRLESNSSGGVLKGTDGGVITTLVRSYGDSYFNGGGGNFGIGTTTPNYLLDVEGTGSLFRINSTSGAAALQISVPDTTSINDINFGDSGSTTSGQIRYRHDGDSMAFSTGGSEALRVDSSGNLAIGNTNASAKLDIRQNSGVAIRVEDSDGGYFGVTADKRVGIGHVDPTEMLHIKRSSATGAYIRIQDSAGGNYLGTDSGNLQFFNGSASEIARFDTSGNLGIGTNSPWSSTKLDLSTSGDARMRRLYIYDSNRYFIKDNYGIEYNTTQSSGFHKFVINSSEIARIDSTGLGIGTTSAGAAVDIIGSGVATQLRLSNTASDSTTKYGAIVGRHYDNSEEPVAGLLLTSSSNATAQAVDIGGGISAANMVNQIIFHTASNNTTTGSNERMRIDNNGRVGIATNSPAQALEVAGSIRIDNGASFTAYEVYRDNILYGRVGGGSNQFTIQADNNKDINIFDDSGSGLTVKDGGNVGIGQSSPSQKLHVNGNIRVGSTDKLYFGGTTNYVSGSHGSNYLHFFTNSSERVRIDSSGRVGIGTDAPTAKLDVAGSIVSDGLTVNTGTTNTVAIFKSTDDKAFIRLEDDDTDTFLISKDGHFSIGENSSDLDNFKINLSSGALTINSAYTLPTADGVTGSFLKTDGSGNLSWSSNTITSFSSPGTGYLITSDSSLSSGVSGEPTLQYEGAYDGLTLLESGGHNAYLSFGASDDTTATGQIRFYSASTPVTLTGAAGELQLTNGDFSASGLIKAEKIQLNASGSDNPQIQLNNNDFGTFDWLVNQTDGGKFRVTVSGTGGAEMELESDGSDYTNAILKVGNQRVLTQTAGINLNGNLGFNDNYKAQFGTHDDLEIYHDGSSNSSYIKETGAGSLYIEASNLFLQREAGTENFIDCITNGAVTLYYNNSAKLATTDAGLDVTGDLDITKKIRHIGDTDTYLSFANNDDFRIVTGNSTRAQFNNNVIWFNQEGINQDFRVESSDNEYMLFLDASTNRIGLNTSAPSAQLHNVGGAVIFDQTNNGYSGLKITDDADSDYNVNFIMGRDQSNSRFNFYRSGRTQGTTPWADATPSKIAHISNASAYFANKVGIGTDSPSKHLHIKSTAEESTGIIIENTNNAQNLDIDYWNNAGAVQGRIRYGEGPGAFYFYPNTSASSALTILYDGRIGIGTTSPNALLTLHSSSSPTLRIKDTTNNCEAMLYAQDANAHFGTSSNHPMIFDINNSEKMRITTGGYIGIGTSSPSGKLDIHTVDTSAYSSTGEPVETAVIHNESGSDGTGATYYSSLGLTVGAGATSQGFINYVRTADNQGKFTFSQRTGSSSYAESLVIDNSGNATFQSNVTAYSDERLKDNIETLDGKKVLDMRGVSFTRDGKEGSGVIAQELEQVAPELVKTADDEMGTKSVAYGNLVGYLIENAKRQEELIKELTKEINKLKKEVT